MPVSADCYLLCIMMALDTEIIYFFQFERTTNFRFIVYSLYTLGKHAGNIV